MRTHKLTIFAFFLIALSCAKKDSNYIFQNRESLDGLKVADIVAFENRKGSKERLYDNTFKIGYYPNKHNFVLSNPRVFERIDDNFKMETDYVYNTKDGSIKLAFYMWEKNYEAQDTLNSTQSPKFKILQKKYEALKNQLTQKLGKSTSPPLPPGCYLSLVSYCQWDTPKMKAYLAIHAGDIRLAIFNE